MRLRVLRGGMNLRGKRVLVRIDANVPVKNGKVLDGRHGKIARVAVDLEWLRQKGARIIVVTHLGRPRGRRVAAYSVRPVAKRLSELLGVPVSCSRQVVGPSAERAVARLKDGQVMMLENVRFDPREEENSPSFAASLARLADIYINDAFAVSHRAHASIEAITSELPSYAGPLLVNEVQVLSKVASKPKLPFVLMIGGLKMTSKLPVLQALLPKVDKVLVGGALANVFLHVSGKPIGDSVYDKEGVRAAKSILRKWKKKLVLPTDVVVVKRIRKDARMREVPLSEIGTSEVIVDIGPDTVKRFREEVEAAKTVVWNGPLGYCEIDRFCGATSTLAQVIAKRPRSTATVVGGGDTVPLVEALGLADAYSLLSTGGGAMLAFLAGLPLPGLQALSRD